MQQAARVSDKTAFFYLGELVNMMKQNKCLLIQQINAHRII